ncbi:MAG TPA: hypothetical protein VF339_04380 [Gammaproteobacteria bacterium]
MGTSQLPERASLEYLKKLAKERLAQMRRVDPAAKLSASLLEVAREHGFSSWRARSECAAEPGVGTQRRGDESAPTMCDETTCEETSAEPPRLRRRPIVISPPGDAIG